jgi:hypothetical protein
MNILNLLNNGDFGDYTGWGLSVSLPNWVSYHIDPNNAYTGNVSRRLLKTVSGSCGTFQTIDLNRDASGETFEIGGWIKIATCDGGGGAQLYIQWLDSGGSQIGGDVVIDTLSSVQDFTLSSDTLEAPEGTYQIKYWFVLTGGALNVTAYLDNVYIYEEYQYGLKVYDTLGNSSFILPDISSIISSGTVSMPDTLESDGTYGVDIDLPGDEYIDTKNIGVIVQARDFDWKTVIEILSYDSGNKFWGTFFGDDSISYYQKSPDGVMTTWSAGNMTPGTQSTYNPLLNMSILTCWDRFATSIKKVRLFASLFYTFLKSIVGGVATYALYARDYATTSNGISGYMLSLGQGSTERYSYMNSSEGYTIHYSTKTDFTISVVHSDGSETILDSNVASHTFSDTWGGAGVREGQYDEDWSCPGYGGWVTTDALKFVLNIELKANDWPLGLNQQTINGSITYVTPQLGWASLNASTWTLYRYLYVSQQWQANGIVSARIYFGTSSKEVKITNISTTGSSSSAQNVCSIGSNGVSEVDYIIYLKNYDGS